MYHANFRFAEYGNKMIENFLIKFKTTLKTGDEKLGIPILDPYNAERLEINLKEDTIKCVPFSIFSIKWYSRYKTKHCRNRKTS